VKREVLAGTLYDLVTGDEDARVCRDIPESACNDQPVNFLHQLGALVATKIGDELASARLVLPWLLSAVGAPAALAGLLVPIREALALLPQLFVAAYVRRLAIRKWAWVLGSLVQAVCVAGMAGVAIALEGALAGWTVVVLLVVFSLARGVCSVSAKDVMGKTVSKTRRGMPVAPPAWRPSAWAPGSSSSAGRAPTRSCWPGCSWLRRACGSWGRLCSPASGSDRGPPRAEPTQGGRPSAAWGSSAGTPV
jgi:hypothetical protein